MKWRILAIDDEENFLKMLKINLEEEGDYEVYTTTSPKEVISLLHSFKPDVILLDLIMPNLGGLEVCEMLNNDPRGQTTPIIIISALDKEVDKRKAYRLAVSDYLTKPITTEKIKQAVAKAIRQKYPQV